MRLTRRNLRDRLEYFRDGTHDCCSHRTLLTRALILTVLAIAPYVFSLERTLPMHLSVSDECVSLPTVITYLHSRHSPQSNLLSLISRIQLVLCEPALIKICHRRLAYRSPAICPAATIVALWSWSIRARATN